MPELLALAVAVCSKEASEASHSELELAAKLAASGRRKARTCICPCIFTKNGAVSDRAWLRQARFQSKPCALQSRTPSPDVVSTRSCTPRDNFLTIRLPGPFHAEFVGALFRAAGRSASDLKARRTSEATQLWGTFTDPLRERGVRSSDVKLPTSDHMET